MPDTPATLMDALMDAMRAAVAAVMAMILSAIYDINIARWCPDAGALGGRGDQRQPNRAHGKGSCKPNV